MIELKKHSDAFLISAAYLVFGVAWIILSDDALLLLLGPESAQISELARLQSMKGIFYVLVSTVLLFSLLLGLSLRRARLRESLEGLERQHAATLLQLPIGVYRMDQAGNLVFENGIARRHRELRESQGIDGAGEGWKVIVARREIYFQQYTLARKDGGSSWIMDQAFPQHDPQLGYTGYLGTTTDVTSLKEAHLTIDDLQNRLQMALRAGQICLCDWDLASNKVHYSEEWKRLLGYSGDEIGDAYDEWESRLHPEDAARVRASVEEFVANPGVHFLSKFRLRHKDGSYRWIVANGSMQVAHDGRPCRAIATHVDVTRILQAEYAVQASQHRIQQLLKASPAVLYALDVVGGEIRPRWVSESITRILGYSMQEVLQVGWWKSRLHPGDRDAAVASACQLLQGGSKENHYRFLGKDGAIHWIRDFSRLLPPEIGVRDHPEIIGCWNDITHRYEEEERQRLFAAAFDSMDDGMLVMDGKLKAVSANAALERHLGYSLEELREGGLRMLLADGEGKAALRKIGRSLRRDGRWSGEVWHKSRTSARLPFWVTATMTRSGGAVDKYIALYKDMSAYKEQEAELKRLAHTDLLTQLPNRLQLQSRLGQALLRAREKSQSLALLYLDLDDFKTVNDTFGHSFGDELLLRVSRLFQAGLRQSDTLARLGGDEFAVLMEELASAEEAARMAQGLLESLSQPIRLSEELEVFTEACVGISVFPENGQSAEALMQEADTAMHRAKALGRNRYRFFTPEMGEKVARQHELVTALRQSMDRGELELHYQPKYDLRTGGPAGAEALLRWRRPGQGMVSPALFIPLAEVSGLISPLGEWVVNEVARQLRGWLDKGLDPVNIAVNISARQFRDQDIAEVVWSAVERQGVPAELISVEITESALMENPEEAERILKSLKAAGIAIALDDFGTGFSSFAYLSNFALDALKIDISFIRNIDRSDKDNRIISSMVELAHQLGMVAVAEGVEHEEQLRFLRELRCEQAQGYHLGKPVPGGEFEKLLAGKTLPAVSGIAPVASD